MGKPVGSYTIAYTLTAHDRLSTGFSISRRRLIHKRVEASGARIQTVQAKGVTQLLVFFEDRSLGSCMSFPLRNTDVYESVNQSVKYGVRFVDQKFALPQSETDSGLGFLCLDIPELPSEHDDVVVLFDTEQGRTHLRAAPVHLSC